MIMKAVGIKNLKNNLSKYLDMVREGEIVYVTDRDDIIAEIHKPISAPAAILSPWEAFLNEEERKGALVRAKVRPRRMPHPGCLAPGDGDVHAGTGRRGVQARDLG